MKLPEFLDLAHPRRMQVIEREVRAAAALSLGTLQPRLPLKFPSLEESGFQML